MQVLYLRDLPLEMGEFWEAVKLMISDARLLIDKLLMGFKPEVRLENIEDDTCKSGIYDSRGYNFLQRPGNLLDKGIEPMIQAALAKKRSRRLVDIETVVNPDGTPTTIPHWWRSECCKYIEYEHEFMDLLLMCIHLTGGQPARGPEIGSIKHANSTQFSRNIFVFQGLVAIVTCYDKSRTMRDSMHYIVRYLLQEVGLMVVEYLAYVRPFVTAIERGQPTHRSSEYFWIGCKDPFKDTYVTKIFKRMMQKYLGRNLNLRDYRHIAIAIAQEFLHEDLAIFGIDPEEVVVKDK
ncbi:MAG: hypothetical protein M1829_001106 [Trizodia sp. TS-e1964]|nr:MAG: hypothetical protein M1829_001106 [Trizodia sp. TS-e1964]